MKLFLNKRGAVFAFCLMIAFIMLMLCSKCSFLYPFNGWDDLNSFYTVSSGWANGLLPYRDLFEQKGPLLYLIFMLGYFISPGKFIGVFILEVIFLTLTLYVSSMIIDLFIDKKEYPRGKYFILFLYVIVLTTSISLVEGGSSEEFNLLFTTISIYYILKYFKYGNLVDIRYKDLVINGLCCGLSLMIKYTTIGLWFIMMAYICIRLIILKRYKEGILKGFVFIIAMIIPLLGFGIYFYLNNGLFAFLETYFYINIFKYSIGMGIFDKLILAFKNIFVAFFSNIFLVITFYVLICHFLYRRYIYNMQFKIWKKGLIFGGMILFSLIVLYYGQEFRPYAFTVLFFIVLLVIIYLYQLFYHYKIFKLGCLGYILISLLLGIDYEYMGVKKEKIVQYRFANIIHQYDNPTLLQYRSIDEGFYTAAGIIPKNKYFEQVNIGVTNLPASYNEQDRIIRNKEVMFVVVRKFDLERSQRFSLNMNNKKLFNKRASLEFIDQYYDLVDKYKNKVGYYNTCDYYLYKAKE